MGCFSFKCAICSEPINSMYYGINDIPEHEGEHCTLFLLENGRVLEQMTGQYDSYGRVTNDKGESVEWEHEDWDTIVELMCNNYDNDGMCAVHTDCLEKNPNFVPETISKDDPDQGWGNITHSTEGKLDHKILTKTTERGWWNLTFKGVDELTDDDKEHIAKLIEEGGTEGEIIRHKEELQKL